MEIRLLWLGLGKGEATTLIQGKEFVYKNNITKLINVIQKSIRIAMNKVYSVHVACRDREG